jgi:hypothetical protein
MFLQKVSATDLINLDQWSPELIRDICGGEVLQIGADNYGAHMLPAQGYVLTPVVFTRESRRTMHGLMLQTGAMGLTPMQVEAILLRAIQESVSTKGRQVMNIFIDREGVPVINKESGVVVKARPVDNPFSMQIKGSRYAMAIPTAIASPEEATGAPAIRILTASNLGVSSSENQTQVYNFNLGLGPVEFTVKWRPSYEGHMGLQETAAWIETPWRRRLSTTRKNG